MTFTTVFFDLDDTLYPGSLGLWEAIRLRMHAYMQNLLGLPDDQLATLREHYLETYGTTLRGLQMNHLVDTEDFLAYVHDLPLRDYLKPDPTLRAMLLSLPKHRWIFTNSDDKHAGRVMEVLGVADCFKGIIDIHSIEFISKPNPQAYRHALRIAGEADPRKCVYLDDAVRNLQPAFDMGFFTVLVGAEGPHPAACLHIPTIHQLPQAMPDLWNHRQSRD
jgi:pyrimidine 5'-nucleotidase